MTTIDSTHSAQPISLIPDQDQIAAQFGGDAAAELAAMVFLFARERKSDAAEQRDLVDRRIEAADAKQVREMYKQADDAMTSAMWTGFGKIAGGAGQALGGSCLLAGAAGSDRVLEAAKGSAKMWEGGGTVLDGGAQIGAGFYTENAGKHEAEAQKASNSADAAERDLDEVNESRDEALDLSSRVLDFLDTIQEQKAEADQAIWAKG